jgi:DNA invertase Pin-like site-specific DNA recombinase
MLIERMRKRLAADRAAFIEPCLPSPADKPHANKLTVHILAAVAQHEREMISERTIAALQAAKARGVKLGNPNLSEAAAIGPGKAPRRCAAIRRESVARNPRAASGGRDQPQRNRH